MFCCCFSSPSDEVGNASDDLRGAKGNTRGFGSVLSCAHTSSFVNGLIETYTSLVHTGAPAPIVGKRRVGDVEVVQVAPRPNLWAKATNPVVVELWGEPGKAMAQGKGPEGGAGVCGVMNPGNFEGPIDVLHKLFIEQSVVVAKSHRTCFCFNISTFFVGLLLWFGF